MNLILSIFLSIKISYILCFIYMYNIIKLNETKCLSSSTDNREKNEGLIISSCNFMFKFILWQ